MRLKLNGFFCRLLLPLFILLCRGHLRTHGFRERIKKACDLCRHILPRREQRAWNKHTAVVAVSGIYTYIDAAQTCFWSRREGGHLGGERSRLSFRVPTVGILGGPSRPPPSLFSRGNTKRQLPPYFIFLSGNFNAALRWLAPGSMYLYRKKS